MDLNGAVLWSTEFKSLSAFSDWDAFLLDFSKSKYTYGHLPFFGITSKPFVTELIGRSDCFIGTLNSRTGNKVWIKQLGRVASSQSEFQCNILSVTNDDSAIYAIAQYVDNYGPRSTISLIKMSLTTGDLHWERSTTYNTVAYHGSQGKYYLFGSGRNLNGYYKPTVNTFNPSTGDLTNTTPTYLFTDLNADTWSNHIVFSNNLDLLVQGSYNLGMPSITDGLNNSHYYELNGLLELSTLHFVTKTPLPK